MSFIQSFFSRKLIFAVAAIVAVIKFPQQADAIITILGIYIGGNVAQKFTPVIDVLKQIK